MAADKVGTSRPPVVAQKAVRSTTTPPSKFACATPNCQTGGGPTDTTIPKNGPRTNFAQATPKAPASVPTKYACSTPNCQTGGGPGDPTLTQPNASMFAALISGNSLFG